MPEYSAGWERGDRDASEFYVYILHLNDNSYYVGQTRDLRRRLSEHQQGTAASTAGKNPQLAWYNTVATREQATALELQLKNRSPKYLIDMMQSFDGAIKGVLPNLANHRDLATLNASIQQAVGVINSFRGWLIAIGLGLAAVVILLLVILLVLL